MFFRRSKPLSAEDRDLLARFNGFCASALPDRVVAMKYINDHPSLGAEVKQTLPRDPRWNQSRKMMAIAKKQGVESIAEASGKDVDKCLLIARAVLYDDAQMKTFIAAQKRRWTVARFTVIRKEWHDGVRGLQEVLTRIDGRDRQWERQLGWVS